MTTASYVFDICECGYVKGPHTFTHGVSGYTNHKCHCPTCTQAWRENARRRRNMAPSALAQEVDRLNHELDAAELNLHALREENMMLRCRLQPSRRRKHITENPRTQRPRSRLGTRTSKPPKKIKVKAIVCPTCGTTKNHPPVPAWRNDRQLAADTGLRHLGTRAGRQPRTGAHRMTGQPQPPFPWLAVPLNRAPRQ
jgi:hypothetical protein